MMDVARLAGVSHQTVSRVVNGSGLVADGTRERVLEAMRALDYQPSAIARALKTGRSKTIGVVSFATNLYGPASTLLGIERAAHEAGYFTSIVGLPQLDAAAVSAAIERLRGLPVDGIVVIAPERPAVEAVRDIAPGLPVVAVEAGPEASATPVVAVDQFAGARAATEHLLELGHTSVFHLAGPQEWPEAELRVAGWRAALEAAGREPIPPVHGDWTPGSGYLLGRDAIAGGDATAVFVGNDQMALGLLHALHEAGHRVPHEISVVGFDDIPECAFFEPPLTTVRQDFAEMGRRSFSMLLDGMEGTPIARRREAIAPTLVIRDSTAAPPRRPS